MKTTISKTKLLLACILTLALAPYVFAGTVTISPSDDSYVSSADNMENYGISNYMIVGEWDGASPYGICRSYLMFDLSSIPAGQVITSAELHINCKEIYSAPVLTGAHFLSDDTWTEYNITWYNAPTGFNSSATDTQTLAVGDNSWNVTSDAQNTYTGDGTYSVVMKLPTEAASAKGAWLHSKEYTEQSKHPYLEVEYENAPEELDYGDAPDDILVPKYPTLSFNNGACHPVSAAAPVYLGNNVDSEINGQPNATATGDDIAGIDDEDGVTFTSAIVSGGVVTLDVVASIDGYLNAWLDLNADGDWADLGEQIFTNEPLNAGNNSINFSVPFTSYTGDTFARFRFSTFQGLSYQGRGLNGEVEDYKVTIESNTNVKWIQMPDVTPNGIDIRVDNTDGMQRWLGDDFECSTPGLITDIHLWCSWLYNEVTPVNRFKLSIFSDDPIGEGGSDPDNQFSKPDELLWNQEFVGVEFTESLYAEVQPGEWWWDVLQGELIENGDTQIWQYDIYIEPERAFRQTGSSTNPKIYWLVVRVETFGGQIGWKTRRWPAHYNDDAVFDAGSELPRIWRELRYPPGHPYYEYELNSIDMAFVITTQPETEPAMDLGDAPDSTNNYGSIMNAYPGVQANFPTVFNDGTGAGPYGPLHKLPETVAFLGEDVTLELEADTGPDEDGVNNIDPPNNAPDQDVADDGVLGIPLNLPRCKPVTFKYDVNVVNPLGANQVLYVNAWFDFNRDGDWDDVLDCGSLASLPVPEWAVQNQVLVGLLPGIHTIETPQFLSWHPALLPGEETPPLWMRITLAEQPWSSGSAPGVTGNGGSGPAAGYDMGETEDYIFVPDTTCVRCPDLNCDGFVNFVDVAILANKWLQYCP